MRIILINNVFPPGYIGGYELGMLDVARHLVSAGHEILVLTSDYLSGPNLDVDRLTIDRCLDFGMTHEIRHGLAFNVESSISNWRNIRKLSSRLRSFRPDLVLNCNTAGLGPHGIILFLTYSKIPTISYYMDNVFVGGRHLGDQLKAFQKLFGSLDVLDDDVIVMSDNLKEDLKNDRLMSNSVTTVPGWVGDAEIDADRPFVKNATRRFVFSSRIAEHKGIFILLEAVTLMKQRGFTNFVVDLYGAGQVVPVLQDVGRRDLGQIVRYKGTLAKSDMIRTFADYDALLFPTWEREPFGFVVSEAASAGCIPIMTSSIGASEWFLNGFDALKIDLNAASLASAMMSVMAMGEDRLDAMKTATRNTAFSQLSAEPWMTVIERLCAKSATRPIKDIGHTKRVEAAFLYLSDKWRQSIGC